MSVTADPFFPEIERIPVLANGATSVDLGFRAYDPDREVLGKRMEEHLRFAVCYWHTFCFPGADVFGEGTFDRPWHASEGDPMAMAHQKLDVAFEFISKLGAPFFCFHDRDIAPEADTYRESAARLDEMVDTAAGKMEETGIRLLWGTANLFGHPRYAAGAATNPDPEVFAYAAAQVRHALELTHRLAGENYVLWGGREGYETLLNTDLRRESEQLGRFLALVAEHKHKIGFEGQLLVEPKPFEPTKHQYDSDVAAIYAFLQKFDLVGEYKINIEVNHATLAGKSFQHEIATAAAHGLLGSIDANRGDPQNGWDTDQFPNSVEEMTLALYEILRAGGLGSGGFNFDARLRRQSVDPLDLFHAHIGAMDTLSESLLKAAILIEEDTLQGFVDERYAGWKTGVGCEILEGNESLESLHALVNAGAIDPRPRSGRQEWLENRLNAVLRR
ncbi:MAG: xylose isomerase [bacterium]|nr:xylose isomerase [Deltaproteobacteria bacterium]MCP4903704.1 xylose isomerase [bacterium]